MLTIGQRFPDYQLQGVVSKDPVQAFRDYDSRKLDTPWKVYFFYPKDFTFVCPTEIAGFGKLHGEFRERDAEVYAISTDSEYSHLAWKRAHQDLADLPFPMLSDLRRELSEQLGVLDPVEKVCQRATFVVDPANVIRYAAVHDGSVGRSPEEVLRVLDALQTGELCPCNWKKGDETLKVA